MNNEPVQSRRTPWSGAFFSAQYFWVRAVVLGIFFLLAHLAGLREYTTFLSGTTGNADMSFRLSAIYGTIYLVLYMGCVVLAPIFLLAAALLGLWEHRQRKVTIANGS